MKRNLLIVIGDLDVGGTAQHLARVLPHLNRDAFHITVYTLTHKGALAPILEQAEIPVIESWADLAIHRSIPKFFRKEIVVPLTVIRLVILMRRLRPDVIHFFLPMAYLIGGMCAVVSRDAMQGNESTKPFHLPAIPSLSCADGAVAAPLHERRAWQFEGGAQ